MSIIIEGLPRVLENLTTYQARIAERCIQAAEIAQARIVNQARDSHPYRDRTGNLTNSIQPGDVRVTADGVEAFVEARMQYASFVEFGTSRARPYPFLTPAMLAEAPRFRMTLQREIGKIKL